MEVILNQDVPQLGQLGQVIKVKDGYARNYLIPRKLAFLATPSNLKRIAQQEKKRQQEYAKEKEAALALAEKLNKVSCSVSVEVNDLEKLYGNVSEVDICKSLELEGYNFERRQIILEKPIEELGIYEVGLKLHAEVTAKIRVWVTKK